MSQASIDAWLWEWFSARAELPVDRSTCGDTNYFDAGWIDSFGVVELITDAEQAFGVQFSQEHFQERRFATFGGLVEILAELRGARSARDAA